MTAQAPALDFQRAGLVLALRELIDALDRRGPQIERAGETRIAQDALVLRREAVERLEELERGDDARFDDDRASAIMTDDGGAPQ
jgi:hypothetical protein